MNKVKIMQSSLIVKVVDGQRERHFDKGIEVIPPRTKFIPKDQMSKLQYKPLPPAQAAKLKKLNQIIPKGETILQY